jgi:hypothetical protein
MATASDAVTALSEDPVSAPPEAALRPVSDPIPVQEVQTENADKTMVGKKQLDEAMGRLMSQLKHSFGDNLKEKSIAKTGAKLSNFGTRMLEEYKKEATVKIRSTIAPRIIHTKQRAQLVAANEAIDEKLFDLSVNAVQKSKQLKKLKKTSTDLESKLSKTNAEEADLKLASAFISESGPTIIGVASEINGLLKEYNTLF